MAEHVLVEHPKVERQALVPAAVLSHYEQRGWKKVTGAEAEAVAAAASDTETGPFVEAADPTTSDSEDLASLTREALLEVARDRGVEGVNTSTTKAELLRRLESA